MKSSLEKRGKITFKRQKTIKSSSIRLDKTNEIGELDQSQTYV